MVGGLTGFLILNWNPAKVFMGDSGSYFLGSIYFSCIFLSDSWIIFLALLIIGTPIYLDVIICVIRRAFDKQNIFKPHKLHLLSKTKSGMDYLIGKYQFYTCLNPFISFKFCFGGLIFINDVIYFNNFWFLS